MLDHEVAGNHAFFSLLTPSSVAPDDVAVPEMGFDLATGNPAATVSPHRDYPAVEGRTRQEAIMRFYEELPQTQKNNFNQP